jgi:hypothetical protein
MSKAQVDLLKPLVNELGPRLNAYVKSIRTDVASARPD